MGWSHIVISVHTLTGLCHFLCSCNKPDCIHLLFVMLRVLKVSQNDPKLWSKELKNYEVTTICYPQVTSHIFYSRMLNQLSLIISHMLLTVLLSFLPQGGQTTAVDDI